MIQKQLVSEIKETIINNNIIWWVGAGISMEYPSNAPLAWDLMNSISRATKNWINKYWGYNCRLHKTISKNFNDWQAVFTRQKSKNFDDTKLSLEELLGLLEEERIDPNQELLYLALDALPFNKNHEFLARRIKKGDLVFTTNFDNCIEKAYETIFEKGKICVASDKETILKLLKKNEPSGLIKIHGTLRDEFNRKIEKTIQSTINRILQNGRKSTFGLDSEVEENLKNTFKNKILIIAGYSGGDDLDINPSWDNMTSLIRKSYWCIYPIKPLTKRKEEKNGILNKFKCFFALDSNNIVTLTLREIGDYNLPIYNTLRNNQLDEKFTNWFLNLKFGCFAPLLFLAGLLQECGLSKDAVEILKEVRKKVNRYNNVTKCVYHKTLARIASDLGDYALVQSSAQELIKTSIIGRLPEEAAIGFQLLADLELEKGNLINSIWFINCSIEYGEKLDNDSNFALQHDYNLKAAILMEMGETEEAFEFYLKSLLLAQQVNDPESIFMAAENIKPLINQSKYLRDKICKINPEVFKLTQTTKDEILHITKPIERYRLYSNKYLSNISSNSYLFNDEQIRILKKNKNTNPNMIADRLANIANQYIKQSKYSLAKQLLFQALKIYKDRLTIGGITRIYHLLAIVYYDTGFIDKSERYSYMALDYLDSYYPNKSLRGAIYQLLALIEMSKEKFENALSIIDEAEELKKYVMEDDEVNLCKYTRIQILINKGDYEKVSKLSETLYDTYKKNNNHLGLADIDFILGLMDLALDNYKSALHHFNQSQKIYKKYNTPLAYWRAKFNKAIALSNLKFFKRELRVLSDLVEYIPEGLLKKELYDFHYLIEKNAEMQDSKEVLNKLYIKN